MNKSFITGRVLNGSTVKEVGKETDKKKVANFRVGITGPDSAIVRCTAWGNNAEFFEKWFSDGSPIEVLGAWKNNKYEKNGVTVYEDFLLVKEFGFVTAPKDAPKQNTEAGTESFMQMPDDFSSELPFV